MTRVLLHVGQHKTGSTALQYALAASRASLQQRGILYPRLTGWSFAHHALFPHFFGVEHCDPFILRRLGASTPAALAASAEAWEHLAGEVAVAKPGTLLLSSESFFSAHDPERMNRLGVLLRDIADRVEIVCYLRHPADFVLSSLSTQLQMDDRFLWPEADVRRQVLEAYEGVSPDDIHVIKYDRDSLLQGDVVQDFAGRFLGGVVSLVATGSSINTSFSAEAMVIMQRFVAQTGASRDRAMPYRQQLFRRVLKWLDARVAGYSRPALLPHAKASILRDCTDLDWLQARYGVTWPQAQVGAGDAVLAPAYGEPVSLPDVCHVDQGRLDRLQRLMSVFAGATRPLGNFAGFR